jgi:hypothetical protein
MTNVMKANGSWRYGTYTVGCGDASSEAECTSLTTPTMVIAGSPIEKCWPIGSRPGQKRCASEALTMATSGRPSRGDRAVVGVGRRVRRKSGHRQPALAVAGPQGQAAGCARELDAGNRLQRFERARVEVGLSRRIVVASGRRRDGDGQEVVWIKAGGHVLETNEALDREPRADEQHQ